jgi:hypothetical protein
MRWGLTIGRWIQTAFLTLLFACLLGGDVLLASSVPSNAARRYTRPYEFDYVSWTVDALAIKLEQSAIGSPHFLDEPAQVRVVKEYLQLTDGILDYENRINLFYTDPQVSDPVTASAHIRQALSRLQARYDLVAPVAEAVLQQQITMILTDVGLTLGGQPFPPVLFHVSPLPYDLVISPRSKIQQDALISLAVDLPLETQITIEDQVEKDLDVSSLVVPVGGIGSYPTMVMRTTSLPWLVDTIAHEWIHNWLTLRPLGMNYESSPELRTMNETTASIAGGEIASMLMQRYYPELLPDGDPTGIDFKYQFDGTGFNFNREMHATRIRVDELLAQDRVEEAEAYMEQRRSFFWQNGYAIRKLNQAYFAFYGAYADVPLGAAGEDPVGPAVRQLRQNSPSLASFLRIIARMRTFQQLQAAVSQ